MYCSHCGKLLWIDQCQIGTRFGLVPIMQTCIFPSTWSNVLCWSTICQWSKIHWSIYDPIAFLPVNRSSWVSDRKTSQNIYMFKQASFSYSLPKNACLLSFFKSPDESPQWSMAKVVCFSLLTTDVMRIVCPESAILCLKKAILKVVQSSI